jgi:hypothetical protein
MNSAIATNERRFVMLGELEATLKESPFLQTVQSVANLAQQGPGDDPDGDEADNLTEHAFGTDPSVIDSYPVLGVESGLAARLRMPATPPDDVRYEIEEILDLPGGLWQVKATRDGAGPWIGMVPQAVEFPSAGRADFLFALPTHPRAFYRVRLTLITP